MAKLPWSASKYISIPYSKVLCQSNGCRNHPSVNDHCYQTAPLCQLAHAYICIPYLLLVCQSNGYSIWSMATSEEVIHRSWIQLYSWANCSIQTNANGVKLSCMEFHGIPQGTSGCEFQPGNRGIVEAICKIIDSEMLDSKTYREILKVICEAVKAIYQLDA